MDIEGAGAVAAAAAGTLTGSTVAIIAALYLLGGFVKGTAAFGQPLIVIPLSSFFVPIPTAIAISVGPIIVSNLVQVFQNRSAFARMRRYWPFYLGIVAGIPLGFGPTPARGRGTNGRSRAPALVRATCRTAPTRAARDPAPRLVARRTPGAHHRR
jgi:hypothetical protein